MKLPRKDLRDEKFDHETSRDKIIRSPHLRLTRTDDTKLEFDSITPQVKAK